MKAQKNWLILIGGIIIVIGAASFFLFNKKSPSPSDVETRNESELVATNSDIEQESAQVMLDQEIAKKVAFLNRVLRTNYLKIVDFKKRDSLGDFSVPGVQFYQFVVDYDMSEEAVADYDIRIDKGSISFEDFQKKKDLYKQQMKNRMLRFYQIHGYDRMKKIGILGYVKHMEGNNYGLYQLGDFIYEQFYNNTLKPETIAKLEVMKDYLNYEPIFFQKEPDEVYRQFQLLQKELKNEKFDQLAPILTKVFFYDVEKK